MFVPLRHKLFRQKKRRKWKAAFAKKEEASFAPEGKNILHFQIGMVVRYAILFVHVYDGII